MWRGDRHHACKARQTGLAILVSSAAMLSPGVPFTVGVVVAARECSLRCAGDKTPRDKHIAAGFRASPSSAVPTWLATGA